MTIFFKYYVIHSTTEKYKSELCILHDAFNQNIILVFYVREADYISRCRPNL